MDSATSVGVAFNMCRYQRLVNRNLYVTELSIISMYDMWLICMKKVLKYQSENTLFLINPSKSIPSVCHSEHGPTTRSNLNSSFIVAHLLALPQLQVTKYSYKIIEKTLF